MTALQTLWGKNQASVDALVAAFTVGDDREVDARLATQDVLGSLAHLQAISAAKLISEADAQALTEALRALYAEAVEGTLRPGPSDEDIHSAVERLLTERLGDAGKRIHVARSRNDQVATDVALWMREQALDAAREALTCADAALGFARAHASTPLVGMTHLQPAMPSSFGLWAAGYAGLWLDDAALLKAAFEAADACPLGSAAGYGVPKDKAPIDRAVAARALAFSRVVEPVTAVQGGRGKPEATLLFAMTQASQTCARFAWDVVLYVHPDWGFLTLPEAFVTGSSIMPQKRNPDVMELVRARAHTVRAALVEVLGLAGGLPSGYHRDFQLLKSPLMRGVDTARAVLRVVAHVLPGVEVNAERAAAACRNEIHATDRALGLVAGGAPFRDAYRQVSAEFSAGHQFPPSAPPDVLPSLDALSARAASLQSWLDDQRQRLTLAAFALTQHPG
jgi:argininosuccinate lyase